MISFVNGDDDGRLKRNNYHRDAVFGVATAIIMDVRALGIRQSAVEILVLFSLVFPNGFCRRQKRKVVPERSPVESSPN